MSNSSSKGNIDFLSRFIRFYALILDATVNTFSLLPDSEAIMHSTNYVKFRFYRTLSVKLSNAQCFSGHLALFLHRNSQEMFMVWWQKGKKRVTLTNCRETTKSHILVQEK